jgi:pyrroloquinoline quinone (PQQ) biosynthesis protein C
MDATSLIADLRHALRPVEEYLAGHPYVQAIEEGRLPLEELTRLAGEQYASTSSRLRSLALMAAHWGERPPAREFFLTQIQREHAAFEALLVLALGLGQREDDLRHHEPLPGAQAGVAYFAWLALYGTAAATAAAEVVVTPVWSALCARLSRALVERYGLSADTVAFFDLGATPPAEFEGRALEVVQAGLNRGEDPALIRRAARLTMAYHQLFWDTLAQAARLLPGEGDTL